MAGDAPPTPRSRVLVTGVSGLVGRHTARALLAQGHSVVGALRRRLPDAERLPGVHYVDVGDIGPTTRWEGVLENVDAIVHSAAHAHVMSPTALDEFAYRRVNVEGTRVLANAARKAGVRRLLFVSSIKVNGEATPERAFSADDIPAPRDAFGRCKYDGEQVIRDEMPADAWVIVRPPLVYGRGMRGNFARMTQLVARGWPLPFGSIVNRRSFVGAENLADLIVRALEHPRAVGRVWLAADGEDLSTPELVRAIATAQSCAARMWPCPVPLLRAAGVVLGKGAEMRRLTESLYVDAEPARSELGWQPRWRFAEGLSRALGLA